MVFLHPRGGLFFAGMFKSSGVFLDARCCRGSEASEPLLRRTLLNAASGENGENGSNCRQAPANTELRLLGVVDDLRVYGCRNGGLC